MGKTLLLGGLDKHGFSGKCDFKETKSDQLVSVFWDSGNFYSVFSVSEIWDSP